MIPFLFIPLNTYLYFNFRDRVDAFEDPKKAMEDFIARQKMGRLGTAEEIAGAVIFLSSKDVRFQYCLLFFIKGRA